MLCMENSKHNGDEMKAFEHYQKSAEMCHVDGIRDEIGIEDTS